MSSARINFTCRECTASTDVLTCSFALGLILAQLWRAAKTCATDCEMCSSNSGLLGLIFQIILEVVNVDDDPLKKGNCGNAL